MAIKTTENIELTALLDLAGNDIKKLIADSESAYASKVSLCVDEAIKKGSKILMLAGPSSSGKTTTSKRLDAEFEKRGYTAHTVSLDDFYLNRGDGPRREDGSLDFETIYALDIPAIMKFLSDLAQFSRAVHPVFDFVTAKRSDKTEEIILDENDILIIEGLHALNPMLTKEVANANIFKIYLNVSSRIVSSDKTVLTKRDMRFLRRLVRDYNFRDADADETFDIWRHVLDGEQLYLAPNKKYADITINSVHYYETFALKNAALGILETVDKNGEFYDDMQRLRRSLQKFPFEVGAGDIPSDSMLHEFIG